ncbi:MAG: hypothetical protein HC908_00645 [Calothrix sp. SM1_7_51]|nr:hypothetical protein [Calothrix sp. SM1_7_51]
MSVFQSRLIICTPKQYYPRFEELAKARGLSLAELARLACLDYLERNAEEVNK